MELPLWGLWAAERDRYGPAAPDQFYKMWDGAFLGLNDDTTIAP